MVHSPEGPLCDDLGGLGLAQVVGVAGFEPTRPKRLIYSQVGQPDCPTPHGSPSGIPTHIRALGERRSLR